MAETKSVPVCTLGAIAVHPICLLSIPHPSGINLGQGTGLGLHRAWQNWALDPSMAVCPLWSLTLRKTGTTAPDG